MVLWRNGRMSGAVYPLDEELNDLIIEVGILLKVLKLQAQYSFFIFRLCFTSTGSKKKSLVESTSC